MNQATASESKSRATRPSYRNALLKAGTALAFATAATLAACGGGGGGASGGLTPSTPSSPGGGSSATPTPSAPLGTTGDMVIRIKIPINGTTASLAKRAQAAKRRDQLSPTAVYAVFDTYSSNTYSSITSTTNISLTSSNTSCSAVGSTGYMSCSVSSAALNNSNIAAVGGTLYYQVYFYDSSTTLNSTTLVAQALSQSQTWTAGSTNTISLTLGGVPSSLRVENSSGTPITQVTIPVMTGTANGNTETSTVKLIALDASGYTIVGSSNYANSGYTVIASPSPSSGPSISPSPGSFASPGSDQVSNSLTLTYKYNGQSFSGTNLDNLQAKSNGTSLNFIDLGSSTTSMPIEPMVITTPAATTQTLAAPGSSQTALTFSIAEPSYSQAFSVSQSNALYTVSCSPNANCTPSSAGGTVTVSLTPNTLTGTDSVTIADAYSASKSISFTENASLPVLSTSSLNFVGTGTSQMQSVTISEYSGSNTSGFSEKSSSTCTTSNVSVTGTTTLSSEPASAANVTSATFYITPLAAVSSCTVIFQDTAANTVTLTVSVTTGSISVSTHGKSQ